jgi:hypothetical protein
MVFIFDDQSEFDAPIDKVWKFIRSHKDYPHTHHHNSKREQSGESSYISSYDFDLAGGRVININYRGTAYAPLGIGMDFIGGTFEGSKLFQYFTPIGTKTRVTIVGHLVSPTLSDDDLMKAFSEFGEIDFNEDEQILSKFNVVFGEL